MHGSIKALVLALAWLGTYRTFTANPQPRNSVFRQGFPILLVLELHTEGHDKLGAPIFAKAWVGFFRVSWLDLRWRASGLWLGLGGINLPVAQETREEEFWNTRVPTRAPFGSRSRV